MTQVILRGRVSDQQGGRRYPFLPVRPPAKGGFVRSFPTDERQGALIVGNGEDHAGVAQYMRSMPERSVRGGIFCRMTEREKTTESGGLQGRQDKHRSERG